MGNCKTVLATPSGALEEQTGNNLVLYVERHRTYCSRFGAPTKIPRQKEKPHSISYFNSFENWKGLLSLSLLLIIALQEL